ncbi:MAG: cell division protein FtsL [Gammaproteobacteria bacterium]|nr:MAG: cell division protein FtsL [Gammaproteobacteria bacterium]
MLVMLVALVFSSALGVVWFTHQSRLATAEIARLQSAIGELDLEWNQLRIEESTLSDHARIEKIARERLGMEMPGLEGSVMIARERDDAGVAVGGLTPTAGGED